MHFSPLSPPSDGRTTVRPHAGQSCKIVTFYEDFDDAVRTLRKSEDIMRAFSRSRPVSSTSWSFELLGKPELNAVILQDVSQADVIVVACHGESALPARVASWVAMCLAAADPKKPAIVAVHAGNLEADAEDAPLCKALRRIADGTDATFMCNRDIANAAGPAHTFSVQELPHAPTAEDVRRWGINE